MGNVLLLWRDRVSRGNTDANAQTVLVATVVIPGGERDEVSTVVASAIGKETRVDQKGAPVGGRKSGMDVRSFLCGADKAKDIVPLLFSTYTKREHKSTPLSSKEEVLSSILLPR